jgi:hypothetical protein
VPLGGRLDWRTAEAHDRLRQDARSPTHICEVVSVSAGPSWPAARGRPRLGVQAPSRPLAPLLFIASELPILAQADFEEEQQHCSTEPDGHQGDGEHLAGQAADQDSAHRTGDDERGG